MTLPKLARKRKLLHPLVETLDPRRLFAGFSTVLDSSSTAGIIKVGNWTNQTGLTYAYNGNQLIDSASAKGQQRVKYVPTLPQSGQYQVFGWWQSTSGRSSAVPYIVQSVAGSQTVLVDQRANPGQWNLLGTYTFTPGQSQGLTISNAGTTGTVVADAVKFVLVSNTVPLVPKNIVAQSVSGRVQFTWVPGSSDELSFQVQRQTTTNGTWSTVATLAGGSKQWNDTAPVDGASYRVRATNSFGESPWSTPARAWKIASVGAVSSVTRTIDTNTGNTVFSTTGGSLGSTSDAFGFNWQKLSGDGQIVVRLSSLVASSSSASAGVQIRQSLATNSPRASLVVNKASNTLFTSRAAFGSAATSVGATGTSLPQWLKLVRVGDVFTAYRGTDGYHWTTVGRSNIAMGTDVYIGLIAASDRTSAATATFTNITVDDTPDDHTGWSKLFNGSNLNGLYTYTPSKGVNNDPAGMFKASNGELKILDIPATSATVDFGYVATTQSYSNYRLRWEYRWDTKKFSPRQSTPRDSGVIFNFGGPDQVWPAAPEFQIQEADVGDAWLIGGTTARTTVESTTTNPTRYKEGGTSFTTLPADYRQSRHNAQADTLTGWNTCELIVSGDDAVYIVNGVVVNKLFDIRKPDPSHPGQMIPADRGKILFQAEGAAVSYRNIEIKSLNYQAAPTGSTVLFGGSSSDLSKWTNQSTGGPATWQVADGALKAPNQSPEVGTIRSNATFKDFTAHVEFKTPFDSASYSEQLRGNSGIYLQGRYELQVLDSFGNTRVGQNDGGAFYEIADASSNQSLPSETWQTYDISFTAAKWSTDGLTKLAPARVSVWWNGTLVQDNVALPGPTVLGSAESSAAGPLVLQSHWSAVQFRNIWVKPR